MVSLSVRHQNTLAKQYLAGEIMASNETLQACAMIGTAPGIRVIAADNYKTGTILS